MRRLRALVLGISGESALMRSIQREQEKPKTTFATGADLDRLAEMGRRG